MRFVLQLCLLSILLSQTWGAGAAPSVTLSREPGEWGMLAGYQLCRLELRNPDAVSHRVVCTWRSGCRVDQTFFLKSGEVRSLTVVVPFIVSRLWEPEHFVARDEDGVSLLETMFPTTFSFWDYAYSGHISAADARKIRNALLPLKMSDPDLPQGKSVAVWPADCRAYLGGKMLLIPKTEFDELPPEPKNAMLEFVALGGVLVKTGANVPEQRVQKFGCGYLVDLATASDGGMVKSPVVFDPDLFDVKNPQLKAPVLALRGIFGVMAIFCLTFGPLCYWALLRLGRLPHILWILPLSSLLFVGGLVMFTGLNEGWRTRSSLNSLTFLDQRNGLAVSGGSLEYYAALTEPRDMEFGDAMIFLFKHMDSAPILNLTDGQKFVGGTARPRMVGTLPFRRVETRTEHLKVKRLSETELEIENALKARLLSLEIKDARGEVYRVDSPVAAGAKARLTRQDGEMVLDWRGRDLTGKLQPGCYVAWLENTPFLEPGARADSEASCLIGTLEVAP